MKKHGKRKALVLLLALALAACGGPDGDQVEESDSPSESSSSEATVESQEESREEKEIPAEEEKAYQEAVVDFQPVTMEGIRKMEEEGETALIYAGAPYCPYCRQFAPLLHQIAQEKGLSLYYLNAEEASEDFDAFAAAHQVEYIPSLFRLQEGETTGYDTYYFKVPFEEGDLAEKLAKIME